MFAAWKSRYRFSASIMNQNIDFEASSSAQIAEVLCKRLDALRLGKNISQADLARQAGVSRSTLTRIADGQSVSLDSFIRVAKALGLAGHLAAMLPDPAVRPVELARNAGTHRRRARSKRPASKPWTWGEPEQEP